MIDNNYLIDHDLHDWTNVLQSWSWLLPEKYTIWLISRFGDLFVIMEDGSVHMLQTDSGQLKCLASSRDTFTTLIEEPQNANEWFLIPLVKKLVVAEKLLRRGYCYGYRQLPILGGTYDVGNIVERSIGEYLSSLGNIYQQMRNLPDGTTIRFKINP